MTFLLFQHAQPCMPSASIEVEPEEGREADHAAGKEDNNDVSKVALPSWQKLFIVVMVSIAASCEWQGGERDDRLHILIPSLSLQSLAWHPISIIQPSPRLQMTYTSLQNWSI